MILWLVFYEYDFDTNPELSPESIIGSYLESYIGTKFKILSYPDEDVATRVRSALVEGADPKRPWCNDLRSDLALWQAPDAWVDEHRVWRDVKTIEDLAILNDLAPRIQPAFYPMELHFELP